MKNRRKVLFVVWFFALWGIVAYALFERFGYPRNLYGFGPAFRGLFWVAITFSLLVATGGPLYLYFTKRKLRKTGTVILTMVFLASTIFLAASLVQPAIVSTANKSKVQWYMDDLKSQGFNVEYLPSYGGKVFAIDVDSYPEAISLAKEFNTSTIWVYGGVPTYFMFFVPSNIIIQFSGNATYRFGIAW
jgi:hypothetical protein